MSENLKNLIKNKIKQEKQDKRGPKTLHQLLAVEIAESFGKLKSRKDVAILMNLCKRYNNQYIRRIWGLVKEKDIDNKMAYFLAILKNINQEEKIEKIKKLKIIFVGTSEFAVPILRKIKEQIVLPIAVITQPDKPAGRKKILASSPIKIATKEYKLKILQPRKIITIKDKIKKLNPDIFIMASYGQIIPQAILNIPRYGCLNVHPSLLPKYRGPSPIQTAILNNDKQTGVCIMLTDNQMDHGAIIKCQKYILNNENFSELQNKLSELGAELLIKILLDYIDEKIKLRKQNHKKAIYTKILTRDNGKINWNKKAKKIEAQTRALYPWPGCWSRMESGKRVKIIQVSILNKKHKSRKLGELFLLPNKKTAIQCGQGTLILEKIQVEGKKQTDGKNFLQGNKKIKLV
ncbi:MAG: methionyl-tRNA formyltransferase [Patescibacteria group bacterium]|nr:methionyl-tRNA formyltransferase [Patescibacteria group bacterium]